MTIALSRPRSLPGFFLLFGIFSLGSCRSGPVVESVPAKASPPLMRLCGSPVPAEEGFVQAEVLRHVAPGMPVEAAAAQLRALGFSCHFISNLPSLPKDYAVRFSSRNPELIKVRYTLYCKITAIEIGTWGRHTYPLSVLLRFDEHASVTGVEVEKIESQKGRHADFFERQPELREPTGLPVEQAKALMTAHHFFCNDVPSVGREGGRPYLDCVAYDPGVMGDRIIRVHLYYDAARTVTETEVSQSGEPFGVIQSMLPHQGDTRTEAATKILLFPVRLGTFAAIYGAYITLWACLSH